MKKPSKELINEVREIVRTKHYVMILKFDSQFCLDEVEKTFKGLPFKEMIICEDLQKKSLR